MQKNNVDTWMSQEVSKRLISGLYPQYTLFRSNVHAGLIFPPQLDSPFLPEAMFLVFVLISPPINKDLQSIPPN